MILIVLSDLQERPPIRPIWGDRVDITLHVPDNYHYDRREISNRDSGGGRPPQEAVRSYQAPLEPISPINRLDWKRTSFPSAVLPDSLLNCSILAFRDAPTPADETPADEEPKFIELTPCPNTDEQPVYVILVDSTNPPSS